MDAKQQHYVPQFYLEGFTDPGQPNSIWVYDRNTGDVRLQGVRNTGVAGYFYSLKHPTGERDNLIDRAINDKYENAAAPIIRRWRSERPPMIVNSDLEPIARFLGVTYVRSPRVRKDWEELMAADARAMLKA
ncbi:MAG: DUF4238 domain-containing protein, partial [Nitrospiraceae bacterium]